MDLLPADRTPVSFKDSFILPCSPAGIYRHKIIFDPDGKRDSCPAFRFGHPAGKLIALPGGGNFIQVFFRDQIVILPGIRFLLNGIDHRAAAGIQYQLALRKRDILSGQTDRVVCTVLPKDSHLFQIIVVQGLSALIKASILCLPSDKAITHGSFWNVVFNRCLTVGGDLLRSDLTAALADIIYDHCGADGPSCSQRDCIV